MQSADKEAHRHTIDASIRVPYTPYSLFEADSIGDPGLPPLEQGTFAIAKAPCNSHQRGQWMVGHQRPSYMSSDLV